MTSPVKRRQRGCILTSEGLKKLQQRIYVLENTKGIKYNACKIAELAQLRDPAGLHPTTVRKVLRQESVDKTSLELLFTVLDLTLNSEDHSQPYQPPDIANEARQDWGESSDVSDFYGRQQEIELLKQWIIQDNCRLIAVLGMGGIGKTTLVTHLAQQLTGQFSHIIWRSLRNAPPLTELLDSILAFFAENQPQSSSLSQQITEVLNFLREYRCLLILDNFETIFQAINSVGCYQSAYEVYGDFFKKIINKNNQSCLILTSREKPQELTFYEEQNLPVCSLFLKGFKEQEGESILKAKALNGTEEELRNLTQLYQGNPLALKIVATSIKTLFSGKIQPFLTEKVSLFHGIKILLDQQFERLSSLEKQILYELAIARYPIDIEQLKKYLFPSISLSQILENLEFLHWRSLIETHQEPTLSYGLHPIMMEYLTEKLITGSCQEIIDKTLENSYFIKLYGLLKAQEKDYIRQSQIQFLIAPILEQLKKQLGTQANVEKRLRQMLQNLRENASPESGYLGGNLLNFLVQLPADLTELDLSHLTLWQGYLKNTNLHRVNLSSADVSGCVFQQTFENIYSLGFSQDSQILATGHQNGEISFWRIADGELILSLQGHQQTVWCLAFSSDNQTLASGGFDGEIILWNLTTEQPIYRMKDHQNWVWGLDFHPDGNTLVSGSRDGAIKLWDAKTGECQQSLTGCDEGVTKVKFSPVGASLPSGIGQSFASGGATGEIQFWRLSKGQWIASHRFKGHQSAITDIAFHPNGQIIVTSAAEGIKLWNSDTGECLTTWEEGLTSVWGIAFSPDGQTLALSDGKTIKLWDLEDNQCFQTLTGYDSQIWSIAYSRDGKSLAGCDKQQVIVWNAATRQRLQTLQGYRNSVATVAIDPQGRVFASGGSDGLVRIWAMAQGNCLHKRQFQAKTVRSVNFSPDGQLLASGGDEGKVSLWHWQTGHSEILRPSHQGRVWSVAFSPNGQWLASGGEDETIQLWELKKGAGGKRLLGHKGWVLSVSFSRDNRFLASSGIDRTIKIWNLDRGECYQTLHGHKGSIWSVIYHPNGQLISGGEDGNIRLWEFNNRKQQVLTGHQGLIWSVIISPDEQWLASSSIDRTIRLWWLKTGECRQIIQCDEGVRAIAFTPDGQQLISGSSEGLISIWDINKGNCLQTLVIEHPYEGLNIQEITGLTENQKRMLTAWFKNRVFGGLNQ